MPLALPDEHPCCYEDTSLPWAPWGHRSEGPSTWQLSKGFHESLAALEANRPLPGPEIWVSFSLSPPWGSLRTDFSETVVTEALLVLYMCVLHVCFMCVLHVCASCVCLRPAARQAPPGEACRHVAHEHAGPRAWEAGPKVWLVGGRHVMSLSCHLPFASFLPYGVLSLHQDQCALPVSFLLTLKNLWRNIITIYIL